MYEPLAKRDTYSPGRNAGYSTNIFLVNNLANETKVEPYQEVSSDISFKTKSNLVTEAIAEKFDDENSLSISSAPLEVLEINKKISIEPQIKKKVEANILSFSEDSVICNIPQDNGKDYYTISLSVGLFGDMTISKGLPIWICIADEGIKTIYIESRTIQKILDKKFESLLDRL